jgi:hypothetical protein
MLMKTKNVFAAIAFMVAIGTAVASEYLVDVDAYSRQADVQGQLQDCQVRGSCPNVGSNVCQISFDHDGLSSTPNITRDMWNSTCAVQLKRP